MEVVQTTTTKGADRFKVFFVSTQVKQIMEILEQEIRIKNCVANELFSKFSKKIVVYSFKPTEYACLCKILSFYDLYINAPNSDVEKIQNLLLN